MRNIYIYLDLLQNVLMFLEEVFQISSMLANDKSMASKISFVDLYNKDKLIGNGTRLQLYPYYKTDIFSGFLLCHHICLFQSLDYERKFENVSKLIYISYSFLC